MRIGVNLYALSLHGGGMRQYVLQLLPALVRRSSHHFVLFSGSASRSSVSLILKQISLAERYRVRVVDVPHQEAIHTHSDLFDFYFCPLNSLAPDLLDRPTLATLADVQEQFFPEYFTPQQLELRAVLYPRTARAATRLITLSEFSKQSICRSFGVSERKVHVTHLAPNSMMIEAQPSWPAEFPKPKSPFVIYPANLYPHKRHDLLLQTLAEIRDRGHHVSAVMTGQPASPGVDIHAMIAAHGLGDRVMWLGHVEPAMLRYLYERSLALCFPSQFEGFGLPLVEAMQCGCPIIATRAASIPEIAGEAALLVDPTAKALADAITLLEKEPERRADLIRRGHERGKLFNVDRLADQTLRIIDETVEEFTTPPALTRREAISYVVAFQRDEAALRRTLTSLTFEMQDRDEVMILAAAEELSPEMHALAGNIAGSRLAPRTGWLTEVQRPLVCLLPAGDELVEWSTSAVQLSFGEDANRVAVVGETLALDRRLGKAFRPGEASPSSAAVFWRREFLLEHTPDFIAKDWVPTVLSAAGERLGVLERDIARCEPNRSSKSQWSRVRSKLGRVRRSARDLAQRIRAKVRRQGRLLVKSLFRAK